ncbi:MAG: hypothetical protein K6G76_01825 [Lachnospiraceae bacterium]|nr:hypothetical protein [Lachnospiraceae bacterium]
MLKKHWKFVNWSFSEPYIPKENNDGKVLSVFSVALFLFLMFFSSFLRIKMSLWTYLFFYMMCFNRTTYKNGFGRFERSLPVKDSFIVNNILFAVPITYILFVTVTLGLFLSIMSGAVQTAMFGSSFLKEIVGYMVEMIRSSDVLRIIFSISVVAGIWFLMAMQIFYKKASRKIAGQCVVIAVMCIVAVYLSGVMKSAGVTGEYKFSEVIYVLPTIPAVVVSVVFALVSGVYSWIRAMYLYRHNVTGQAMIRLGKGDAYDKSKMVLYSKDSKKARLFAAIGVLSVGVIVMAILIRNIGNSFGGEVIDSGKGEVHYTSSSPEEYGDWDSCLEHEGVPEAAQDFLYDWSYRIIIFPSVINEEYIKEYYAKIDGDYSYKVYENENCDEPGSSCSYDMRYARFLVADYPKEEFEKECDRLANLSYKDEEYDEDEEVLENHVLIDEDNFPARTYIAVYNYAYKEFEYAIADENTGRIIYVFLDDCTSIPTDVKYEAEKPYTVVPITKRNYREGYSIYEGGY